MEAATVLNDFFPVGNNVDSETLLHMWGSLFVSPNEKHLERLRQAIKPVAGEKRVVLVQGHPRTGKTWATLRAILDIVESEGADAAGVWTSGIDSCKLYVGPDTTLLDAYRRVEQTLERLKAIPALNRRIIFLDDFLGTVNLRPLGATADLPELRRYLRLDEHNPILAAQPAGSTLVLTSRSLFILLARILARRLPGPAGKTIRPTRINWGIFTASSGSEIQGVFDSESLQEVFRRHQAFHPDGVERDLDSLLAWAPLLAFGPQNPWLTEDEQKLSENARLTFEEQRRNIVADALFGHDFDTLSESVALALSSRLGDATDQIRYDLCRAYMTTVAPGLVFLEATALKHLGVKEEEAEEIVECLYYKDRDLAVGRLPNEFYMRAAARHLSRNFAVATDAIVQLASAIEDPDQVAMGAGIALRGLIERCLKQDVGQLALPGRTSTHLTELRKLSSFKALTYQYPAWQDDVLIQLELNQAIPWDAGKSPHDSLSGEVAAVGWAMHEFFAREEHRTLCSDVVASLLHGIAAASEQRPRFEVVAAFSTLLQWCIKTEQRVPGFDLTKRLFAFAQDAKHEVDAELQMVMGDECVWALLEKEYFLQPDLVQLITNAIHENLSDSACVNLYFTFCWHNEWMAKPPFRSSKERTAAEAGHRGRFRTRRSAKDDLRWLKRHGSESEHLIGSIREFLARERDRCLDVIRQNPRVLDDNLAYHWHHFITQRAAWLRDWCFQDDPGRFEASWSQITEGSSVAEHHERLFEICVTLIERAAPKTLRDILLLLGSRRKTIGAERLAGLCDAVNSRVAEAIDNRKQFEDAVLVALFELFRQGLLWEKNAEPSEASEADLGEQTFRAWCRRYAGEEALERTWRDEYMPAVIGALHRTDLRPDPEQGWRLFQDLLFP